MICRAASLLNKYVRVFAKKLKWPLAILAWLCAVLSTGCNEGFFDDLNPAIAVQAAADYDSGPAPPEDDSFANRITPVSLRPYIYRVEVLASTGSTPFVIYNRARQPSGYRIKNVQENSFGFTTLEYGRQSSPNMSIKYAKIYYSLLGTDLSVTDFADSNEVGQRETFYLAVEDTEFGGLTFLAGDLFAKDRNADSRPRWLDSTLQPVEPFSDSPTAKVRTSVTYDGFDDAGSYIYPKPMTVSIGAIVGFVVKIVFGIRNIFVWNDDFSDEGTFDGQTTDIFNFEIRQPSVKVEFLAL